ncbi:hypothetical protein A3K70_04035 [Candidatus Bathyarchaeota archaeon RBG_16_48_13]|nr:MAG: hypothetical protein A3K70_04035 [Candidatus Bathyarchaeota archaeon RBG_16_48_13]
MDKGLTVITGPNGSGKSNILDSVRFVLGESSPRELRASKFSEALFDGAQGLEKPERATVSIQFENSDRQIPVDTNPVTISREVDRTGQSIYRLNGKKVSRNQLLDVLNMARISASGFNMVPQNTITRLADITPEERRRMIEDLVGIADYEAKKTEAQIQLQQADLNLKIAGARIEEVQNRVQSLERERNDALRYNFMQTELKKSQAIQLSLKMKSLQSDLDELNRNIALRKDKIEELKKAREQFESRRDQLESERREFDEEVSAKGGEQLFMAQRTMGELSSQITALKNEIESGGISLRALIKMREGRSEQINSIKVDIDEKTKRIKVLHKERDDLLPEYEKGRSSLEEMSKKEAELKQSLSNKEGKGEESQEEINDINQRLVKINSSLKGSATRYKILEENLNNLELRRSEFEEAFKDLKIHLQEIGALRDKEDDSLKEASDSIAQKSLSKETTRQELLEADRIASRARASMTEFHAQKEFVDNIASEEKALKEIEDMGEAGAIPDIYGRLRKFVKSKKGYESVVDAAAGGWMNSVIVKDLETAAKCIESLKRIKIGQIKLIPLQDLSKNPEIVEPPVMEGILGKVLDFIDFPEKYSPAVKFIFGDTLIAQNQRAALIASKLGYRTVVLSGDIYELGGGLVSGYYRTPVDVLSLIPSDVSLTNLDDTVNVLQSLLERRRNETESLAGEVEKLGQDQIRREALLEALDREISTLRESISRTARNVSIANKRVKKFRRSIEKEKSDEADIKKKKAEFDKRLAQLLEEQRRLALGVKRSFISKLESQKSIHLSEVSSFQERLSRIDSELNILENSLQITYRPELERAQIEIRSLEKQIMSLQSRIEEATSSMKTAEQRLPDLKKEQERLTAILSSVRKEKDRFEEELAEIDGRLRSTNTTYEPLSNTYHQLELDLQGKVAKMRFMEEQLMSLGYQRPLEVEPEVANTIDMILNLVRFELEKLGSVNQLAIRQYVEQIGNYKQLSIRINELEREKRSILDFVEEIERKKKNAFMDAYLKISESFQSFFTLITGGGNAWLQLQNSEDPFSGGLDVFAQFTGKAPRLISGASGGEKSVVAVSFIFALHSFKPMPFYFFDEIDASLDPINAERLANLLKDRSAMSQFVVITLKDVVVARAERLFGVFIQSGHSHIASINLPSAVEKEIVGGYTGT